MSVFNEFCDFSSIHGTTYWNTKNAKPIRTLWFCTTFLGFSSAVFMIWNNFKTWESNPIIVSVWQVPIEESPFPAITLCPLDESRYRSLELSLNEEDSRQVESELQTIFRLILFHLLDIHELSIKDRNCQIQFCSGNYVLSNTNDGNCSVTYMMKFFKRISFDLDDAIRNEIDAFSAILSNPDRTFPNFENDYDLSNEVDFLRIDLDTCKRGFKAAHFLYKTIPRKFSGRSKEIKLGTLISWILENSNNFRNSSEILSIVDKILEKYSDKLGNMAKFLLSESARRPDSNLKFSSELLESMKLVMSPAEVFFSDTINPRPGIPYCLYESKDDEGIDLGYETKFCKSMQPVINDEGLCYSFNNDDFRLHGPGQEPAISYRNVRGPGIKKGLTLVVDSHGSKKGYTVLVTKRGDVGGKVQYTVRPSFHGETNFYFSGIHYVQSTPGFKEWNAKNGFCYFPNGKNLTYFPVYSQENCLIECKIRKVISDCGCGPWFVNQTEFPVCDSSKMEGCFRMKIENYKDDLSDRKTCDCRNDCEMVHFIFTMNQQKYIKRKPREFRRWFDERNGTGILADYLLDPKNIFGDSVTKGLTEALISNDSLALAQGRFENDIAIMNFYYNTPIITYVFLELKISVFDQISAIGGQLGLFTGFSLISGVEIGYWILRGISSFFV